MSYLLFRLVPISDSAAQFQFDYYLSNQYKDKTVFTKVDLVQENKCLQHTQSFKHGCVHGKSLTHPTPALIGCTQMHVRWRVRRFKFHYTISSSIFNIVLKWSMILSISWATYPNHGNGGAGAHPSTHRAKETTWTGRQSIKWQEHRQTHLQLT